METKKLSQEELQQLTTLQEKTQAITLEFGQIELIKLEIEDRVQAVKAYLSEIKEEEKTLVEYLQNIYGEGTIDLVKGEFVPVR